MGECKLKAKLIFTVVSVLLLNSCETSQPGKSASDIIGPPVATTNYELTASDRKAVEDGVKTQLKDPTSPLFGSMMGRATPEGSVIVCGQVNAKNSYGGYTGNKPFIGMLVQQGKREAVFAPTGMGGSDIENTSTGMMCAKYGIAI